MREISLSISASSSAAAHAAPPPTAIAAGGEPSPLSDGRPRLGLGHRGCAAAPRPRRASHSPVSAAHGQPARVRARERLRVRDRPLRMHLLEHDGVGRGGERRVGVRGDRHARARAGALRDLDHVAELARRGHGEHRVARLPGKALARPRSRTEARRSAARRARTQRRQPQRVRDVVRGTVAGGDDPRCAPRSSSAASATPSQPRRCPGARPEARRTSAHNPVSRYRMDRNVP